MSALDDFRAANPAYKDVPDAQLADGLFRKFYADRMSRDDFDKKLGLAVPAMGTAPDETGQKAAGIGVTLGAPEQPAISNYQPTPAEFAADDAAIAARKAGPVPAAPAVDKRPFADTSLGKLYYGASDTLDQGLSLGFKDELAGLGSGVGSLLAGNGFTPGYEAGRDAQRASVNDFRAGHPVAAAGLEIAGGVGAGLGASRAGLTLMNAARPTVGSMLARGAGEGAAYGAVHGFGSGEGGLAERAKEAGKGALVGAATGGAAGAVAGKMAGSAARKTVPTTQKLKAQGTQAYTDARAAGLVIQPQSFDTLVSDIASKSKLNALDPTLHPNTTRALQRLEGARGNPLTLQEVDTLRQVLRDAQSASKPGSGDARLAGKAIAALDDFMENLKPSDIAAGDASKAIPALNDARDLWARFRKGETVETLIQRAKDSAPNFSASGLENALRTQFRQLLMNPKRLRGFTPDEVAAIRKVARGGPIENTLRMLGKFAPTGVVSGGLGTSMGAAIGSAVGGPAGAAIGSVALPAAGAAARQGAKVMTQGNVDALSALIRSGGSLPTGILSPAQRAAIEAIVIGGAQQGPALYDASKGRIPNPLRVLE